MIDSIYKKEIREVPLSELVSIRAARRPERVEDTPFGGAWPYLDIQALESGAPSKYAESSGFMIYDKDLVIVKDGHRSGKVFHAQKGIAASTLAIMSPVRTDVLTEYLYCYLVYCYDDLQNKKRGTTIGHLDMTYLKRLSIPLPDINVQQEIAGKYQRIETLANEMKKKVYRLKELSIEMGSQEVKKKSEELNLQVEMMLKAWLSQVFKRVV